MGRLTVTDEIKQATLERLNKHIKENYIGQHEAFWEHREKSSEKIISLIVENPQISAKELADAICISSRAVEKHLSKLKEKGILKRIGAAKGGYWEIVEK